ncbi:MAG: FtsX-like permease family protein, partial [Acidobacteriota bacterium]
ADTYMAYFLLDDADYDAPETRVRFFEQLQAAVAAIPGVESASFSTSPPVPNTGIVIDVPYRAEGQGPAADDAVRRAAFRIVTPGYFSTLGLPLVAGRDVERFDDADAPDVVVINESLATRLWGGAADAVGRRLEMDFEGHFRGLEVVGVVGDTRFAGLHRTPRPALFIPHAQLPFRGMGLTARTGLDGDVFARELRRVSARVDARVPPADVFSLEHRLQVSYGLERFFAVLLSAFAGVALVLTAGGIYGVFSVWVSERTREIGMRMALGAARREVVALVVRQGIGVALGGVAVGAVAATWASGVIRSRFAGVSAADPLTATILVAGLLAVVVLACLAPAVRASRIEPTSALRSD